MTDTVGGLDEAPAGGVEVGISGLGDAFFQPITPERLSRLNEVQAASVADVQRISMHLREVREELDEAVRLAREDGISWHLIGWSVGTTAEGARQRWGG